VSDPVDDEAVSLGMPARCSNHRCRRVLTTQEIAAYGGDLCENCWGIKTAKHCGSRTNSRRLDRPQKEAPR
jgi:hypothetical protein